MAKMLEIEVQSNKARRVLLELSLPIRCKKIERNIEQLSSTPIQQSP